MNSVEQVVAHQPAIRFSISFQHPFNRAGGRTSNDCPRKMKTFGSATTFHVSDVGASLRFYTDVLGFSERFRFGDYAGISHGDVQIHLSGALATNKKQIGQGSIYIFCDDVDSYYSEVSRSGATSQAPPRDYEYGMRDFVIEDPDLNLVTFGQEIPHAIKS